MTLLELLKDEKVNKEFIEALNAADLKDEDGCIALLTSEAKKHGVEVSEDEIKDFLAKVPLSDDELDNISGGYWLLRKSGKNLRLTSVVNAISKICIADEKNNSSVSIASIL